MSMKIGRSRDNCSYTDRERLISRRKEDIMNKYIMIDENNRNVWEELKEWTLEELKEFFTTDTPEYSNVEKMKELAQETKKHKSKCDISINKAVRVARRTNTFPAGDRPAGKERREEQKWPKTRCTARPFARILPDMRRSWICRIFWSSRSNPISGSSTRVCVKSSPTLPRSPTMPAIWS